MCSFVKREPTINCPSSSSQFPNRGPEPTAGKSVDRSIGWSRPARRHRNRPCALCKAIADLAGNVKIAPIGFRSSGHSIWKWGTVVRANESRADERARSAGKTAKPCRTCRTQAIYAASRINQLRKSSSAASHVRLGRTRPLGLSSGSATPRSRRQRFRIQPEEPTASKSVSSTDPAPKPSVDDPSRGGKRPVSPCFLIRASAGCSSCPIVGEEGMANAQDGRSRGVGGSIVLA
jgi:hypothetical protein